MKNVAVLAVRRRVRKRKLIVLRHQGRLCVDEFEGLANIKPNAVDGLCIHWPPHFQKFWEELFAEVKFLVDGDVVKHLGLQNVETGIDDVAERLFGCWFFQKTTDETLSEITVHGPVCAARKANNAEF